MDIPRHKLVENELRYAQEELELMAQDRAAGYAQVKRMLQSGNRECGGTENAARRANEKLPDYVVVHDGRTIQFANPASARLTGIPENEMPGMSIDSFIAPESRAANEMAIRKLQADPAAVQPHEIVIQSPDGGRHSCIIRSVPVRFRGSSAILSLLTDITERKQMEDALRKSEEKFRLLVENCHDIIYTLTADGVFIFVSPAWTTLLGHPVTQVTGQSFRQFIHPDDIPGFMVFLKSVIGTGQRQEGVEYRVQHTDGTWYWHTSSAVPLRDEAGTIVGFYGIAHDITRRKQVEGALRMANKKLNLLSGITRHDIRNQLMALNAYIKLSEEGVDNPAELKEFFARELKITGTIAHQISFAKDYETMGVKSPFWQNVNVLIRNTGAALPMRNIRLDIGCSGLEVFADSLLEKVFYNLIDNSLRYGGKITTIRFSALERDGNEVLVCEDDGDGVLAEEKEKIFERGFGKNTGLGLTLTREILSITGITITETGEPGKGARFEMTVAKGAWRMAGNGA
ncbi:MAG: PAS domain S-box protein [Methanoregula sp.]|nr:PAS domain S-box protein [Methanoregula sp.]